MFGVGFWFVLLAFVLVFVLMVFGVGVDLGVLFVLVLSYYAHVRPSPGIWAQMDYTSVCLRCALGFPSAEANVFM